MARAPTGQTGIRLYITPTVAGQTPRTVVERADDDSGSPDATTWAVVGSSDSQSPFYYTDDLPMDGNRYHYRVYHTQRGFTDSATRGTVNAKPVDFDNYEEGV